MYFEKYDLGLIFFYLILNQQIIIRNFIFFFIKYIKIFKINYEKIVNSYK